MINFNGKLSKTKDDFYVNVQSFKFSNFSLMLYFVSVNLEVVSLNSASNWVSSWPANNYCKTT